jgi:hypothetical protein
MAATRFLSSMSPPVHLEPVFEQYSLLRRLGSSQLRRAAIFRLAPYYCP